MDFEMIASLLIWPVLRDVDESSLAGGFSDLRLSRELILQIAAVSGRYTERA